MSFLEKKSMKKLTILLLKLRTKKRMSEFSTSKIPKIMFYTKNINFKNFDISVVKISKDSRFEKRMSDSDSGRESINMPKCPFLKKIILVYREYQNRKVLKIILLTIFLLFSYIMPHFYLLLFDLRKSICFLRKVTIRQRQN